MDRTDTFNLQGKGGMLYPLALFCAVLLAALFWIRAAHQHHVQQIQPSSSSYLTGEQLLKNSTAICQEVIPTESDLQLTANPYPGRFHNWWSVACRNAQGQPIAYLIWNSGRGELVQFNYQPRETIDSGAVLSARVAVATARSWLNALGAQAAARWKLAGPPQCQWGLWGFHWMQGERRALVQVDAYTGNLRTAYFWHEKSRRS